MQIKHVADQDVTTFSNLAFGDTYRIPGKNDAVYMKLDNATAWRMEPRQISRASVPAGTRCIEVDITLEVRDVRPEE